MARDKITVEDLLAEIRAAQDEPVQQPGMMMGGGNPDITKLLQAGKKFKAGLDRKPGNQGNNTGAV